MSWDLRWNGSRARQRIYLSSGIDNLALHRSDSLVTSREAGSIKTRRWGRRREPLNHLGLIVRKSADDVDRWAEFLKRRGVTLNLPRTHGRRAFVLLPRCKNQKIQVINHHPPKISDKA